MERRRAIIAAATASLTMLAGAAAIGFNTGLVGASGDDGVGNISPVDPAATSGAGSLDEPAPRLTVDSSTVPDDDESDRADDRADDRTEAEHEYEGADDDD